MADGRMRRVGGCCGGRVRLRPVPCSCARRRRNRGFSPARRRACATSDRGRAAPAASMAGADGTLSLPLHDWVDPLSLRPHGSDQSWCRERRRSVLPGGAWRGPPCRRVQSRWDDRSWWACHALEEAFHRAKYEVNWRSPSFSRAFPSYRCRPIAFISLLQGLDTVPGVDGLTILKSWKNAITIRLF
jgi:hypothetical protein